MKSLFRFILRALCGLLVWLFLLVVIAWSFGALWYDLPAVDLRRMSAVGFALAALLALLLVDPPWQGKVAVLIAAGLVAAWWFTLQPRNDRNWQPNVSQTPWAEVNGDVVTVHNVRNCEYRAETDYTPRWETRTVHLSQLTGVDLALSNWGSEWMAHPILSFQFADAPPLAFSIETRREIGEPSSMIGGLYRQFELVYVAADERDVIGVRTNYRKGESVYLYRGTLSAEKARERFLEYVKSMNDLREHPRWYNAVATNCTTSIRAQHTVNRRMAWDWRILLNGHVDELFHEIGVIASDGLPFPELKKRALINVEAQVAGASPAFSKVIRAGRPGFGG